MSATVTVHQFPAALEMQPSPFGLKLETWMRMNKLPYEVSFSATKMGPKGKVPFVTTPDLCLGDSEIIIDLFQKQQQIKGEENLPPDLQAKGILIRRLIEDHFYFILVYSRWADPDGWPAFRDLLFADVPGLIRGMLSRRLQKRVIKYLKDQGVARHSKDEIYQMADHDLQTLSVILGERPYFLADRATLTDASVYGLLANIYFPPTRGHLFELFQKYPNLAAYCDRMKSEFWQEAIRGGGEGTKYTS
ncbi:MAG: glutathione S-transferase family protein [Sneathiella sp.]|nr:glutathione S-transferase family protein [Sneathiella sp.]